MVRKIHRALALFFSPFLILSALTGLLWAYSPYLYLRQEPGKSKPVITEAQEARVHLSPVDAIHTAQGAGEKGNVSSVTLKAAEDRIVYVVAYGSKSGPQDVTVDAENGVVIKGSESRYRAFHRWVMKLHRLEFFGTKKELTAIPGTGLLLMLFTGLFLFKRGLK
jgi:uncharacterized iron-regulated membrane protein